MSVETINGFVLLAEPADWTDNPTWTLKWDTEVAGTLRGNEGRSALREMPRPALQYKVQPLHTDRQARLMAALTVGLATGKCCAPTWGRASWLAADAALGAGTLQIEPSPWAWKVGDWLLIYADDGSHQTAQITAIDGAGTTFTVAALAVAASAATAVYPIFSGRPELTDIEQTNGSISSTTITLTGDEFVINPAVPAACLTGNGGVVAGLLTTWKQVPQGDALVVNMGTAPPDGYEVRPACLRFVQVTGGAITEFYNGDLPQPVRDATLGTAAGDGIYVVEFFGYRHSKKNTTPGPSFISSSDNFAIYLLQMM